MLDFYLHIYHIFSSKLLGLFWCCFLCVYWVVEEFEFCVVDFSFTCHLLWVLAGSGRIIPVPLAIWDSLADFLTQQLFPKSVYSDKELISVCLFLPPTCCQEHSHVDMSVPFYSPGLQSSEVGMDYCPLVLPSCCPDCKQHLLPCFNLELQRVGLKMMAYWGKYQNLLYVYKPWTVHFGDLSVRQSESILSTTHELIT